MTITAAPRFRLPRVFPPTLWLAAALALLAALAALSSPASAHMPMANPMAGPMFSGGMFGGTMMLGPIYPATYGMGMPSYGSNYASIYSAPVAATTLTSSNAYTSGAASYSTEGTYTCAGQYCSDQSGEQVWVPSGGAADGLNCNGSNSYSGSISCSGDNSGSGSGYTP